MAEFLFSSAYLLFIIIILFFLLTVPFFLRFMDLGVYYPKLEILATIVDGLLIPIIWGFYFL